MTDAHLKVLEAVLGPTLAALLTGGALLLQAAANNRLQRARQKAELDEARRKEEAEARVAWAAAFQDAYAGERGFVRSWADFNEAPSSVKDRAIKTGEARNRAIAACGVATARLQVADRDPAVRAKARALYRSLVAKFPDHRRVSAEERKEFERVEIARLDELELAFSGFLDELAGLVTDDDRHQALRSLVARSHALPAALKDRLLGPSKDEFAQQIAKPSPF